MASDLLRPHFRVPVHENVHHHDVVLTGWKNTQQLSIRSIHHSDNLLKRWDHYTLYRSNLQRLVAALIHLESLRIFEDLSMSEFCGLSWNPVVRSARLVAFLFWRILISLMTCCWEATPQAAPSAEANWRKSAPPRMLDKLSRLSCWKLYISVDTAHQGWSICYQKEVYDYHLNQPISAAALHTWPAETPALDSCYVWSQVTSFYFLCST